MIDSNELFDVKVDIAGDDGEFFIEASFPKIVPISAQMEPQRAVRLHQNVCNSMESRLRVFNNLLNLIARKGELPHWMELDVSLTALAVLLEERGLDGALSCIRPTSEGIASVAPGSRTGN